MSPSLRGLGGGIIKLKADKSNLNGDNAKLKGFCQSHYDQGEACLWKYITSKLNIGSKI